MVKNKADFTKQEDCIADLLGQGKVASQIARDLGITISTLRIHLGNMRRKLGVVSTPDMIARLVATRQMIASEKRVVELRRKLEAILPFSMISRLGAKEEEAAELCAEILDTVFGKEKGEAA